MSQENVEIVKAWYDAFNREDWDAMIKVSTTGHHKGRDGIEVVVRGTNVWTIRNGAIERIVMHQDKEDALEDLGLSEQDAHAEPS